MLAKSYDTGIFQDTDTDISKIISERENPYNHFMT